jgi:hypothetical protein
MGRHLKRDAILQQAGLNQRTRRLTDVLTVNRLVAPAFTRDARSSQGSWQCVSETCWHCPGEFISTI